MPPMFIKRLEIFGFKSFPYKVTIPFSPGITAIIGPNGAGKSNILDAIKWVLGEQSPKRLRVKELSDLIFSGNTHRKVDFAEVKLVINHQPPKWEKFKDLNEIVITRRFYRSGEGEFFINQRPCRLKDIQFLFLELGISSQGYAIIEQGEISKFVEITPKERKVLLEDLSGVSKFKLTEEEVKRNIKKTKENLVRINDLIEEVRSQYEKLKAQSQEAKEFLKLKNELETLQIARALKLKKDFTNKIKDLTSTINFVKTEEADLKKRLISLEEEEQSLLQHILILEREAQDLREEISQKEKNLSDIENHYRELLHQERDLKQKLSREKLKAENEQEKVESIKKELEDISSRLKTLKKEAEELKVKLENCKSKKQEVLSKLSSLESSFVKTQDEYFEVKTQEKTLLEKLDFYKKEIKKLENELQTITRKADECQRELKKIGAERHSWDEVIKAKTEKIKEVKSKLEELYSKENALVEQKEAILKEKNQVLSQIRSVEDRLKLIKKLLKTQGLDPEIAQRFPLLGKAIDASSKELEILEAGLKELLKSPVVESFEKLRELISTTKENITGVFLKSPDVLKSFKVEFVKELPQSPEEIFSKGIFVFVEDVKTLFSPWGMFFVVKNKEQGIFVLERQKVELEKELNSLKTALERLKAKEEDISLELKSLKQEKGRLLELKTSLEKEKNKVEKEKEKFTIGSVRLEEQLTSLLNKKEEVVKRLSLLEEEKQVLEKKLKEVKSLAQEKGKRFQDLKKEREELKNELERVEEELKRVYQQTLKIKTSIETLNSRKKELEVQKEKSESYLRNNKFVVDRILKEIEFLEGKIKNWAQQKRQKTEELKELKAKLEEKVREKSEFEKVLRTKERERREIEEKLKELQAKLHKLELKITEVNLYIENLEKELESFEIGLIKKVESEALYSSIDLKVAEEKISQLKQKLQSFTDVNLASIKEFELVSERYNQMLREKEELETAITELESLIRRLKDKSREKLLEVLEVVNQKLSEVFPVVFPNGSAKLVLTEDDPLSAGLELKINIPGKNLRHLHMLSGGEKALCAISILIAFYLVNPGAFCVLDEVDAPLDEKNSLQFVRLLHLIKQKSQVILITHNPHVMKEVDTLLGVTMEEKGVSKVVVMKLKDLKNHLT